MGVEIESLFTAALGLQAPWAVTSVALDTAKRRIDFQVSCGTKRLACPACGAPEQGIHDRAAKSWRHLDFFQFEAWLHAQVPRVACTACAKTSLLEVPWARPGSGFTLLFEALALSLCQELPVAQAAHLLRVSGKRLWRRIAHYIGIARAKDDMNYITVVHDLQERRLLFATAGRDHSTVVDFAADLQAHGGDLAQIEHVCMDMSAAFAKGVRQALPAAQVSYDRFHVVALAQEAMDEVRRADMRERPQAVRAALGGHAKTLKGLFWGMRRNPEGWSQRQCDAMHGLQRSNLASARAWRLKMALRAVYATAVASNDAKLAESELRKWLSWARRCRLEPFKKLASTIKSHLGGVLRGMLDGRSNAYVEAMNGLLQNAKRAARGFRTTENFIAIAYLRMSKLKHLPVNPLAQAAPLAYGVTVHRV